MRGPVARLGGPRLPRDLHAWYLGFGEPPLDDDLLHHHVKRVGRTWWERLPADAWGWFVQDDAVGGADLAHDAGLHDFAVVGDGSCDERHLERIGLHLALAEARLGEGPRGPLLGWEAVDTAPFDGQWEVILGVPKAEVHGHLREGLSPHDFDRDLGEDHVDRVGESPRERHLPIVLALEVSDGVPRQLVDSAVEEGLLRADSLL